MGVYNRKSLPVEVRYPFKLSTKTRRYFPGERTAKGRLTLGGENSIVCKKILMVKKTILLSKVGKLPQT